MSREGKGFFSKKSLKRILKEKPELVIVESLDPYGLETFNDYIAQIEREARIVGLIMARYVTAKNSKEEKAIDILIKSQELEKGKSNE